MLLRVLLPIAIAATSKFLWVAAQNAVTLCSHMAVSHLAELKPHPQKHTLTQTTTYSANNALTNYI